MAEGPTELVVEGKLQKALPGLRPLKPGGPDENWAQRFRDFKQKIQKRGVAAIQWVDALIWHSIPNISSPILMGQKKFTEYEVALQGL